MPSQVPEFNPCLSNVSLSISYHSCGELDKIMFTPPFKSTQILQIQNEERLTTHQSKDHPQRSLPNPDWPSDHVSICADLYIETEADKPQTQQPYNIL